MIKLFFLGYNEGKYVKLMRLISVVITSYVLTACGGSSSPDAELEPTPVPAFASKIELGESLFFDTNLSANRTQSCATCHNPDHAFIDNRLDVNNQVGAVSLGDDGTSLGDRNTPTISYASLTPEFSFGSHSRFNSQQPDYEGFVGGQFLDGRENDLQGQASGPPINSIEMGMADKASVVQRLLENDDYAESFEHIYGSAIFNDVDAAYAAMADSIAEFEKTEMFVAFDSKYDRSLRGEYVFSPLSKAALGKALFFSQQFTNCATCHQLRPNSSSDEVFTNYEFHNIGVPVNQAVRAINGKGSDFIDNGLQDNPDVLADTERGKFKVPTLRNSAVTGPYMHNGVFRELKTVIQFYDHFLVESNYPLNPETGELWGEPEVLNTVSLTELRDGNKLDDDDVEALVCFLRTLTDARYEPLIEENGISCEE